MLGGLAVKPELLDQTPPHDHGAERGVLGSILLDARKLDDVGPILKSEDFHHHGHGKLYGHLVAMHDAGDSVDVTTVANRLR
ncbi:MAG: DnaB-like helicase N-terminal domain-containing protein, partial [Planctomycetota bacterium]